MASSDNKSALDDQPVQGSEGLIKTVKLLVEQVKHNLSDLVSQWQQFQQELVAATNSDPNLPTPSSMTFDPSLAVTGGGDQEPVVTVSKANLDALATEALMLKEFLPKVLNADYLSTFSQLAHIEQELTSALDERDMLSSRCEHFQRRTEAVLSDFEQEKKEKFVAKCEAVDLSQQLSQQADYCSSLGAACCTLLWRVSRHEDSIHSILSGSKVSEFLGLVSSTLQSYLATYSGDMPSEESQEAQFILALCGIVTNMAASAYGRDYLANCQDGQSLIDMLCSVLATAPNGQPCSRMKGLILMSLYNISINQNGLRYLTSKEDLMPVLVWIMKDEVNPTNRLHCLKLLQSLILEPESAKVIHQALEAIPMQLLHQLSSDINLEIQEAALELMSDLNALQSQVKSHEL